MGRVEMLALACFAAVLVTRVKSAGRDYCELDLIGTNFDYMPDAWEIIQKNNTNFHLMFVSKKTLDHANYKCLTTTLKKKVPQRKWRTELFYTTLVNSTAVKMSSVILETKKSSKCYVFDNVLRAYDPEGSKIRRFNSKIIYADLKTCILLWSRSFGYHVWAERKYVEKHQAVPYICVLLYEIYAGIPKHWIYDWDVCPKSTSKI
ncbi:uncharacterized protein LOC125943022 [Dermacentor silvarum]|uniref:uncharacterized protein LOC125943022 n=1 Tax=Dermacentor silvarum TaxID=543639 RepID=UPI002101C4C7|nr:uncharacterized protein LOC125943022 [Dermacentor silvarum]